MSFRHVVMDPTTGREDVAPDFDGEMLLVENKLTGDTQLVDTAGIECVRMHTDGTLLERKAASRESYDALTRNRSRTIDTAAPVRS